ncbi:MAG TPA: hypothetical protein VIP11_22025 [Gemmatimonadaceae bacterium]
MNEVLRALTDWFNDPVEGIVARLATLPRDGGDALPVVGTIADSSRNNLVAQGKYPSVPGIAVNLRQIPLRDGEVNIPEGDGIADVLVRIARAEKDTKVATADTGYILRATLLSWRAFIRAPRTRNQIQIYDCPRLAIAPNWVAIDDLIETGAANGHLTFRDLLVQP